MIGKLARRVTGLDDVIAALDVMYLPQCWYERFTSQSKQANDLLILGAGHFSLENDIAADTLALSPI